MSLPTSTPFRGGWIACLTPLTGICDHTPLQANQFNFVFWLGFDVGDKLYDTGDAWQDLRDAFSGTIGQGGFLRYYKTVRSTRCPRSVKLRNVLVTPARPHSRLPCPPANLQDYLTQSKVHPTLQARVTQAVKLRLNHFENMDNSPSQVQVVPSQLTSPPFERSLLTPQILQRLSFISRSLLSIQPSLD